jgi:hypothetical protein
VGEVTATISCKALEEIAQVGGEIDCSEGQTLEGLATPLDNEIQQVELLGKALP